MKATRSTSWLLVLGVALLVLATGATAAAGGMPVGLSLAPATAAADWLTFGYNDACTGYNPVESTIGVTNVAAMQRIWGLGCDDGWFSTISGSPVVYGDTLYVTGAVPNYNDYCKLAAFDVMTGQRRWLFGDDCDTAWGRHPVASADGVVFYMPGFTTVQLYAVDADSGAQIWEAPLQFEAYVGDTARVTVDEENDLVYIVEVPFSPPEGKLFALDKQTGNVVWYMSRGTGDVSFQGDHVLLDGRKIYALYDQDWLDYAMLRLDVVSQTIDLYYDIPPEYQDITYDANQYILCNDKLVAVFTDHYYPTSTVVVYDVDSPVIVWKENFSSVTGELACNTNTDTIYVSTNPYLYALDAQDGGEKWKYLGYDQIYSPSIANGLVYFLSDSNLYALDEISGTQLFHYPLGEEAGASTQAAIANGMVYFSGNGGTCDLYALAAMDEPISGLAAANDGPTALGALTTLSATVAAGDNVVYAWDLGDGTLGSGDLLTHTYPAAGSYTAVVTASNMGSSSTATTTVLVEEVVAGLQAINDSPTALGQPTTFTATVTAGTNVTYTWDLGDGAVGAGAVLVHTYALTGVYTAVVTASNSLGMLQATTAVTVAGPAFRIYLPLIWRGG